MNGRWGHYGDQLKHGDPRYPTCPSYVGRLRRLLDPPPMMVDQASFDIGKSAAELLLIQIGMGCDKGRPVVSVGKAQLIVRSLHEHAS